MQTEYLIIGLGIAGTLLSYELIQRGKSVIVMDNPFGNSKASVVAGAVVNPVNISKWNLAKHHENAVQQALHTYNNIQHLLGCPALIEQTSMLVFHDNKIKQQLFETAKEQLIVYNHSISEADSHFAEQYFNYNNSFAKISPVWRINAGFLLTEWKKYLIGKDLLLQDFFYTNQSIITPEKIIYKNIEAKKIIFCEGAAAIKNPFFQKLPFTKNRGEALLISVPGLPAEYIYQKETRLVPAGEGLFWCGSNYKWQYDDLLPDDTWRKETETVLHKWLKLPFAVADHIVAERPTTAGQIMLTEMHPEMPSVGIFNGLGTKGFSMAPSLAKSFAEKLISGY